MNPFTYRDNQLYAEEVSCSKLADAYGTPCYIYSKACIQSDYQAFADALQNWPTRICYAVKANSNLAILSLLAELGAGFDVVSGGELERVIRAGGDAGKVVFSGVAKRADEIRRALLAGIYCFNIESGDELDRLESIAREMGIPASVSLRVNPDVDPSTHPYISTGLKDNKFGVEIDQAWDFYQRVAQSSHLHAAGIDCHIGSQLLDLAPFQASFEKIFELVDRLHGQDIRFSMWMWAADWGSRMALKIPRQAHRSMHRLYTLSCRTDSLSWSLNQAVPLWAGRDCCCAGWSI